MRESRAVIFDFDGPLFDGRSCAKAALDETIAAFPDRAVNLRWPACPLVGPRKMIGLVYADAELAPDRLAAVVAHYRERLRVHESNAPLLPEMRSLIERLRRDHTALIVYSSRAGDELRAHLTRLGVARELRAIGREPGVEGKPSAAPLRGLLDELGIEPASAVYVGDSDLDVETAAAGGVAYYHAAWTGEPASRAFNDAALVLRHPGDLAGALLSGVPAAPRTTSAPPPDLERAAREGQLAFYGGAGIAAPSGFGGWTEHYLPVLRQLGIAHWTKDLELTEVLQLFAANPERARRLYDAFRESFVDHRGKEPNRYHYAMLRSRAAHIWTTNYDRLFERANESAALGRGVVTDDETLKHRFRDDALVVKMNGDFSGGYSSDIGAWDAVFTQEQFDLADDLRKEIWRLFEDDYRNASIVFVGVSFRDPMLRRIVALAARRIPRTRRNHFILMRRGRDPAEQGRFELHAENLARHAIQTLFFDEHEHITAFVERLSALTHRPIVGISGNAGSPTDPPTKTLPGGAITIGEVASVMELLGRTLAERGYRVTSGCAPWVGVPPVNAAFQVDPRRARFYLRRTGGSRYTRTAPAVVVPGDSYESMRRRFVGEMRALIAVGGETYGEPRSGVVHEVEIALEEQIPVLLLGFAGGDALDHRARFVAQLEARYRDPALAKRVLEVNQRLWSKDPKETFDLGSRVIPDAAEELIERSMGARSVEPAGTGDAASW